MMGHEDRRGSLALIAWWREMGVADALADTPVDWLARGDAPPGGDYLARLARSAGRTTDAPRQHQPQPARGPREGAPSQPQPVRAAPGRPPTMQAPPIEEARRRFPTESPGLAETAARAAATGAYSLDALREALERFDGCPLKATAKSLCFYRGRPDGRLMIIGEAPGREEDLAGQPFVGAAGQLLDRMLKAIGLGEHDVHITNVVYWRPPGNRTPTPAEIATCLPFLMRQIELVGPAAILTLGGPAAQAVLGIEGGIMRARGKWRELAIGGRSIPAMASLHPAYVLRAPLAKRQVWRDLLAIETRLSELRDRGAS